MMMMMMMDDDDDCGGDDDDDDDGKIVTHLFRYTLKQEKMNLFCAKSS